MKQDTNIITQCSKYIGIFVDIAVVVYRSARKGALELIDAYLCVEKSCTSLRNLCKSMPSGRPAGY